MDFLRRFGREVIVSVLFFANLFVWTSVYARLPDNNLRVYFLDVGQGDSILIDTPSHKRLLLDGGPNRQVLAELGKILPFADKRIDIIIESHPDKDHIGGLPEVVNRYKISLFLEPGVHSENVIDDELKKRIDEKNIPAILARRGMKINFGDGAEMLFLFPNRDVSGWDTNDASIVAKLSYGEKSFLLTGDSPKKTEFILLSLNQEILGSSVLKLGHHGSRTSSSLLYAEAVSPEYAVVSAGKDNSYGHPHKEVLKIMEEIGAQIVSTAELGTILFETDGEKVKVK